MNEPVARQINVKPLFEKLSLDLPKSVILETPQMYPYKEKIEDNWSYYSLKAFQQIKRRLLEKRAKACKMAIIGIGSGVEAIGALKIFDDLASSLVITDTEKAIVRGAAENIRTAGAEASGNIIPLQGSFAEPLETLPFKFDVIFGNMPNLPAEAGQILASGEDKGTFLKSELFEKYFPPKKYLAWALASQYAYLKSAFKVLADSGSVFMVLGGRVPLKLAEDLFADCGLSIAEVLLGFKEQTEALVDFEGYHRLEKDNNVNFDFYLYDDSVKIMNHLGIANPTAVMAGRQLKLLLEPFRVNAGQALELYKRGTAIGHTVHIFEGKRL